MIIDEEAIDEMNETANVLSDRIDDVISEFVDNIPDDDENDGSVPFIIMAAMSTVLTKLALVIGEGRKFILDSLEEMIPTDDMLKEMETTHRTDNVIPIKSKMH